MSAHKSLDIKGDINDSQTTFKFTSNNSTLSNLAKRASMLIRSTFSLAEKTMS